METKRAPVAESPRNIHFYNIFRLVTQDARLAMLFRRLVDGESLGEEDRKELELTGLCRGMNPFRNDVYARVFGTGGPLDLKVAGQKVMLGRKLEAALARKQQLQDDGRRSYAEIGKAVGLSEAAVRQRVQKLTESGVMQVVAVTDPLEIEHIREVRDPRPWAGGGRNLYLRLRWTELTGRRLGDAWDVVGSMPVRRYP